MRPGVCARLDKLREIWELTHSRAHCVPKTISLQAEFAGAAAGVYFRAEQDLDELGISGPSGVEIAGQVFLCARLPATDN